MTIALERLDMEMHTETKEVERLPDGSRVMESSWNVEGVAADLIADLERQHFIVMSEAMFSDALVAAREHETALARSFKAAEEAYGPFDDSMTDILRIEAAKEASEPDAS